jgi:hypothetical protein
MSKRILAHILTVPLLFGCGVPIASSDREPLSEAAPAVTITEAGPTVTVTATPRVAKSTSKPSAVIEEGIWVVGEDIPAGTYRTKEAVEDCSWTIYRTGSNQSDIIAIDIPRGGRPRVTLQKGHDFATRSCGDWEKVR